MLRETPDSLGEAILSAFKTFSGGGAAIDADEWVRSEYRPLPSILEAAEALYAGHSVKEISHAYADDLSGTVAAVADAVAEAKNKGRRVACFVTGVPGSGKSLTGLTLVHDSRLRLDSGFGAVFLSGNGPLVRTVQQALVSDTLERTAEISAKEAKRRVSTFIQNVHSFIEYYSEVQHGSPPEHMIVFDEAQRAWDAMKVRKKHRGLVGSEPHALLEIMERCPGWSVIVGLVGGGQEIHEGEAGLAEWGRALAESTTAWTVVSSPEAVSGGISLAGSRLFESGIPSNVNLVANPALHLSVSARSFRAHAVADWVNAVLEGDAPRASRIFRSIEGFPLAITRSLSEARAWLRTQARGSRRPGLVASSGALRLRAYGIELSSGFRRSYRYTDWFLGEKDDVRSSHSLEVVATEFECQGLELDWVGICWGNDLVIDPVSRQWAHRRFRGRRWVKIGEPALRVYLVNKYRVLLTRAREGMVIFVPRGMERDPTLEPELFESTFEYLAACGLPVIGDLDLGL